MSHHRAEPCATPHVVVHDQTNGNLLMATTTCQPHAGHVPTIDISALVAHEQDPVATPVTDAAVLHVADQIRAACSEVGFFYVTNHGLELELISKLDTLAREFFDLPEEEKMRFPMSAGGRAWRGYFRLGDELTSGRPDMKEGLYFGTELPGTHPRVASHTPLHGPNLFPERPPQLKQVVLDYMTACTRLGHTLMTGVALSLGLPAPYFREHYMRDPLCLFRIFGYPPDRLTAPDGQPRWGVGEHTDYGVLTILYQDSCGGLQVMTRGNEWIEAPPVPGSFVTNIGDMLELMSGGLYRSTPHRVLNSTSRYRISMPFFFDPDWTARCTPLPLAHAGRQGHEGQQSIGSVPEYRRWDGAVLTEFQGTYGQYVMSKVSKVFPDLAQDQGVSSSVAGT